MCRCSVETVFLLFGWWNWVGKHSFDIWNIVPLCLMWTLWKECNCCILKIRSGLQLSWNFFYWSQVWGLTQCSSIMDFVTSLYLSV